MAADEGKGIIAPAGYVTEVAIAFENASGVSEVVDASHPLPVDTVLKGIATDKGASVGTSAVTLMAANTARRGIVIQNQHATANVYISGLATAVADRTSLKIGPGQYYETPAHHVGTGAISIISDTASTPVYAREF